MKNSHQMHIDICKKIDKEKSEAIEEAQKIIIVELKSDISMLERYIDKSNTRPSYLGEINKKKALLSEKVDLLKIYRLRINNDEENEF